MATLLGLLGLAVFIPCILALAAGVTWLVVKLSPNPQEKGSSSPPEKQAAS
jgi:hypothetical protein